MVELIECSNIVILQVICLIATWGEYVKLLMLNKNWFMSVTVYIVYQYTLTGVLGIDGDAILLVILIV